MALFTGQGDSLPLKQFSTSIRAKSDQEWSIAATSGLVQLRPPWPVWIEYRNVFEGWLEIRSSSPYSLSILDETFPASHCSIATFMANAPTNSTLWSQHLRHMSSKPALRRLTIHISWISPSVTKSSIRAASYPERVLCGTGSLPGAFLSPTP